MTTPLTAAQLATIHSAAFRESRPWSGAEFEALSASEHCFIVGDSQGFALGRAIAGEAELLTIAVLPEMQGMGLGRRVLSAFHAAAMDRQAETSFLEVSAQNTTAINLYLSAGYKELSRRSGYYKLTDGSTADALIFQRNLRGT